MRLEAHRRLFPAAEIIVVEPADPQPGQPLPAAPTDHRLLDAPDAPMRPMSAMSQREVTPSLANAPVSAPAIKPLRPLSSGCAPCAVAAPNAMPVPRGRVAACCCFCMTTPRCQPRRRRWSRTAFADPAISVACFRLRFDHPDWLLTTYAFFSRFESALTSFGDQGILVRRSFFAAIGGFPDWPLFEDVDLLSRARRRTRIKKLPVAVTTSAVRFLENGVLRQQLLNAGLMLRYSLGASPESLHRRYESRRT